MKSKLDPQDFLSVKRVHIIGVCGTLMGAYAAFLKKKGLDVTGSDQDFYPPMSDVLQNSGVELFRGYRPENLEASGKRPDMVIIGNAIRADNPEARAAIDHQTALKYEESVCFNARQDTIEETCVD